MITDFKSFGPVHLLSLFAAIVIVRGTRYIMEAPKGTLIVSFENLFGWPGYVFALDVLALLLMLVMLGLGQLIFRITTKVGKKQPISP